MHIRRPGLAALVATVLLTGHAIAAPDPPGGPAGASSRVPAAAASAAAAASVAAPSASTTTTTAPPASPAGAAAPAPSAPSIPAAPLAAPVATPPTATPSSESISTGSKEDDPTGPRRGVVVLAIGDATDAAWPLARAVYGRRGLAPRVDEDSVRALAGDRPSGAERARELGELRAAVRGDDAASRAILVTIARKTNARAVVLVTLEAGGPRARVFVADAEVFDAASYFPDVTPPAAPGAASPSPSELAWEGAARSLARTFGDAPPAVAPPGAVSPPVASPAAAARREAATGRPFYASTWFWAAVGAAALGVGAVVLATRDNGPDTIHLQMQVPK